MDVNAIKLSVAEAVSKLPEYKPEVQAVNLRGIGGQPWYQIYTKTSRGPQYVSAVDGKVDLAMDEAYAAEIAKNFLAGAAVKKTDFLTTFNSEYINIFRILPVHRFDAGDALETRVYVSTTRAASRAIPTSSGSLKPRSSRTFTNSASSRAKTCATLF